MASSSSPQSVFSTQDLMATSSAIYLCNIKSLVPIVLDYTNYTLWKALFLPVFKGYNVYGFIDGTHPCPEPTIVDDTDHSTPNPAFQQWIQLDSIVVSWIQASISPEILQEIIKPDQTLTSRDAWLQIQRLFSDLQNVQQQKSKLPSQLDAGKKILRCRICKHNSEKMPYIRFGPLYSPGENEAHEKKIKAAKDEVWHNILQSSTGNEEETKGLYVSAIRSIEKEARDTYSTNDKTFFQMTGTDFRMMMIKDACFFLQMALAILEINTKLKVVGELLHNEKQQCIAAMFHVGNQIPLVVLKQVINQDYFQKMIRDAGNFCERPKSDLAKMALYELLLLPVMINNSDVFFNRIQNLLDRTKIKVKQQLQYDQLPCDVLHGLHLLLLGPENNKIKDKQVVDGTDDISDAVEIDLEDGLRVVNSSSTPILKKEYRSASELKQAGIKFKAVEGIGIKGIRFRKRYYPLDPFLALPCLLIDVHTQLLLQSLKDYETAQKLDENQREVTSYLRFMHELIQTSEDARVLHSEKIIKGSWKHTEKVPRILKEVAGEEEVTCPKLRLAKFQVNYFDRPPWVNLMSQYFSIIFALTLIQTFYAVFTYHRPPS